MNEIAFIGTAAVQTFCLALGPLELSLLDARCATGLLDPLALETLDTPEPLGSQDTLPLDPLWTLGPLHALDALAFKPLWTFRSLNALDTLAFKPLWAFASLDALALDAEGPLRPLDTLTLHPRALHSLWALRTLDLLPFDTLRTFCALWPFGALPLGSLLALRLALLAAVTRLCAGLAVAIHAALAIGWACQREAGNAGNPEQFASHYCLLAPMRISKYQRSTVRYGPVPDMNRDANRLR